MRGVGKTNLGKSLAQYLGWMAVDVDVYLEKLAQQNIPGIIESSGWEAFRQLEAKAFQEVLEKYPTKTVVSCGGGIVETETNIVQLKKHKQVVHLCRPMEDVVAFLGGDRSRPSFGQDIGQVWERRRPLYEACAKFEFWAVPSNGEYAWPAIEASFHRFADSILGKYYLNTSFSSSLTRVVETEQDSKSSSFFVSLTFPNVEPHLHNLTSICEGADAVEFRADLLEKPFDVEFISHQLALVRQTIPLPIIFTVRSRGQGGSFPDDQEMEMFRLLQKSISWGCEYVDMEICWSESTMSSLVDRKGSSIVIASYHDVATSNPWESPMMMEKLRLANMYGDVIKLVAVARQMSDNFSLYSMLTSPTSTVSSLQKQTITINMGACGQISRIWNHTLTPVTHPMMPTKAAPGQLSIQEIHLARTHLGVLSPKEFYLFGCPIQRSMSPLMHNTGFQVLGLPHRYQICETESTTEVTKKIRSTAFGGGSVTIPLKQDVLELVDEISPAAKLIGAVNTIVLLSGSKPLGDNTDCMGILSCIRRFKQSSESVLVIGAGGTARAACYAANMLKAKLWIWNRTPENAAALAKQFGGEEVQELSHSKYDVVISTIPGQGHSELMFLNTAKEQLFSQPQGVYVELAYTPRVTELMRKAMDSNWNIVQGIEVLLEQGYQQFELWTGRRAPRDAMKAKVLLEYA